MTNDPTVMQDIYQLPAACGHRYGALLFRAGGMHCPTCLRFYPWHTPLTEREA